MTPNCNMINDKSNRYSSSSTLPPSSLSSSSPCVSRELRGCDGPARKLSPLAVPLFSTTISFSQPFSLLRSAASSSNSSTRPDRPDTVRSRLCVLTFFLVRKRATEKIRLSLLSSRCHDGIPEAAVFRLRFSSDIASASTTGALS
jgi:hypothetical protein